jgi:hypothetical protein
MLRGELLMADRTCGCPEDYHLADCPIRTGGREYVDAPDVDDFYDASEEWD